MYVTMKSKFTNLVLTTWNIKLTWKLGISDGKRRVDRWSCKLICIYRSWSTRIFIIPRCRCVKFDVALQLWFLATPYDFTLIFPLIHRGIFDVILKTNETNMFDLYAASSKQSSSFAKKIQGVPSSRSWRHCQVRNLRSGVPYIFLSRREGTYLSTVTKNVRDAWSQVIRCEE